MSNTATQYEAELTGEMLGEVLLAVAAGLEMSRAWARAGVPEEQWLLWKEQSEYNVEPFARAFKAIEAAKIEYEMGLVAAVSANPDWKAKAKALEWHDPDRYGSRERVEAQKIYRLCMDVALDVLPKEWFQEYIRAVVARMRGDRRGVPRALLGGERKEGGEAV